MVMSARFSPGPTVQRIVSLSLLLAANGMLMAQERPDFLWYQQFTDGSVTALEYSADGRYLRVHGDAQSSGTFDMRTMRALEQKDDSLFRPVPKESEGLFVAEGYTARPRYTDILNAKGTKRVGREAFIDVADVRTGQVIWSCKVGQQEADDIYLKLICFIPARQAFICCVTQRNDRKDYPASHANTFLEVNYLDKGVRTLSTSVSSMNEVYTRSSTGRYAVFSNGGYKVLDTRTGIIRSVGGDQLVHPAVHVCRDTLLVYSQVVQPTNFLKDNGQVHLLMFDLATGSVARDTVIRQCAGPCAISDALGQFAYLTPPSWPHGRQTLKVWDLVNDGPVDTLMSRGNLEAYEQVMREHVQVEAVNNMPKARKEAFLRELRTFQQSAARQGWRTSQERAIASYVRDGERTAWYNIPCTLSADSTYMALFISMVPNVQLWGSLKFNEEDLPGQPYGPFLLPLNSATYTAMVTGYLQQPHHDRRMLVDGLRGYLYGAAPPDSTTRWLLLARSASSTTPLPGLGDLDLGALPTYDLGALYTEQRMHWEEYKRAEAAEEEAARERERQREAEITRRNAALMRLQQQIDAAVPATWPLCNACGGTGRVPEQRSTCHCCGGNGGYTESVPTFHKTGDKRVERPNYSSPTHPTIDVHYEPIGYTTYESVRHACDCCGGTGSEGSGPTVECPACGGKGRVPQ